MCEWCSGGGGGSGAGEARRAVCFIAHFYSVSIRREKCSGNRAAAAKLFNEHVHHCLTKFEYNITNFCILLHFYGGEVSPGVVSEEAPGKLGQKRAAALNRRVVAMLVWQGPAIRKIGCEERCYLSLFAWKSKLIGIIQLEAAISSIYNICLFSWHGDQKYATFCLPLKFVFQNSQK